MDRSYQTEQMLIQDLKKSSRKAFNEIYAMYAKRLYAYCLQYSKSVEDAEDIVQDVFVHLWKIRKEIRQEETLKSLLFIMSKNRLINAYHVRISSPIYEDFMNCRHLVSSSDPTDKLEYKEFIFQIKSIIKELPVTQRRVLELSLLHQLGNKEIAKELLLSEQTVKNQLSIGLKKIREFIKRTLIIIILLLSVN